MSHLVTGIASLVTNDPAIGDGSALGLVENAAVVVEGDRIAWVGSAAQAPATDSVTDLQGRAVVPGFVDSHSHLVFAGDRAAEFSARMTGEPYTGGGIATTMAATRAASDEELVTHVRELVAEMRAQGTTTVEIKSGYGLDVAEEARALRIAAQVTSEVTFLGAHVVPPSMRDRRQDYVEMVSGPMLQACAPYARWADVFCEPASAYAFDGDETRTVLQACAAAGLELRVHGNQLSAGPGVQIATELDAASVDHCTHLTEDDVAALGAAGHLIDPENPSTGTVATLLPGVEFSTRSPYPDARRLIAAGAVIGLASDCNPGSCFTSSMPLVIALAVREMNMTPAEALWSATLGGAIALRRNDIGRIRVGSRADLTVLEAPSYLHLAYRPGVPLARTLELAGQDRARNGRRTSRG
ncbi:imidazolonepropionase [Kineosporia sp. NBRC 101677]|uniref:imidazolonepropionase n=1 Tax=Kineosporia sp. NBRC 101677 TaxID=3032197 RepID=UPI0024A2DED1|nr:imidazolonepropionase [Kineosporia sp. NBRC 101677]GLY14225.1 imidazolonepropionase [Kineosporia sp. NBRC 101677]